MKLKDEMGFKGFIVSDWGSVQNITGASYSEQVVKSVNAGIDMLMETDRFDEAKMIIIDAMQIKRVTLLTMASMPLSRFNTVFIYQPQLIRCPRPRVTGPQKATRIATAIMIRT